MLSTMLFHFANDLQSTNIFQKQTLDSIIDKLNVQINHADAKNAHI